MGEQFILAEFKKSNGGALYAHHWLKPQLILFGQVAKFLSMEIELQWFKTFVLKCHVLMN